MAQTHSKTQFPAVAPGADEGEAAFHRGLALGQEYADTALRRIGAWAEEHPGQLLLAGLAAGIVFGKLLFPRRRRISEELD